VFEYGCKKINAERKAERLLFFFSSLVIHLFFFTVTNAQQVSISFWPSISRSQKILVPPRMRQMLARMRVFQSLDFAFFFLPSSASAFALSSASSSSCCSLRMQWIAVKKRMSPPKTLAKTQLEKEHSEGDG